MRGVTVVFTMFENSTVNTNHTRLPETITSVRRVIQSLLEPKFFIILNEPVGRLRNH